MPMPLRSSRTRRNKSDAVIKALGEKGGIIGCVTYRNITPVAACDSIESWCEMVARTVDIAGIDHVGIGTDLIHKGNRAYLDWMRMGRWSRSVNYGAGSAASSGPVADPRWLTPPLGPCQGEGGAEALRLHRGGARKDHRRQLAARLSRGIRIGRNGRAARRAETQAAG